MDDKPIEPVHHGSVIRLFALVGLLLVLTLAAAAQLSFVQVNGTRLHYESAGNGEAVVLIHGALVDGRIWDSQFAELARKYRVIRYDQRGHGRSERNHTEPHSPAEDLAALLDELQVAQAHIVGFSAGGHIALDYALSRPQRVLSLTLIESAVGGVPYDGESAATIVELVGIARSGDPGRAAQMFSHLPLLDSLAKNNPQQHRRLAQIIAEHSFQFTQPKNLRMAQPPAVDRLSEFRVPTLIMLSQFADSHARKVADLLQQRIGPSHRIEIGGAGHAINLERPQEFTRALNDFLDRTIADRRSAARLEAPRVLAVMFHADWCPTCKIIEPRLHKIEREFAGQPILFTRFDLTDDFTIEQSARLAALLGLETYLEQSSGRTGYMLLFDRETRKVLGEVRVKMSDDDIRRAITQAIATAARKTE